MIDEIFDRSYQAGRAELHHGIDALVRKFAGMFAPAFAALHRIEWDAPWKTENRRKAKA